MVSELGFEPSLFSAYGEHIGLTAFLIERHFNITFRPRMSQSLLRIPLFNMLIASLRCNYAWWLLLVSPVLSYTSRKGEALFLGPSGSFKHLYSDHFSLWHDSSEAKVNIKDNADFTSWKSAKEGFTSFI